MGKRKIILPALHMTDALLLVVLVAAAAIVLVAVVVVVVVVVVVKVKDKVHPCTGTEALYTPYGP